MFEEEFMEYASYRNSVVEGKIEECLRNIRRGESLEDIDYGDLTEDEIAYLEEQLQKRQ